jgi:hypothetical protein
MDIFGVSSTLTSMPFCLHPSRHSTSNALLRAAIAE